MKKIITMLAAVLLPATLWAQSPEIISYQTVIRNTQNDLVTDTSVSMQISILQESESGTAVYVETQTPTTNVNGLISIKIGSGTVVSGDFTTIDWAKGPYFIHTEIDPTGDINYSITNTSQLLSVPYALYANTAESVSGGIVETDPLFAAWDKDYNDLINTPIIDGSETKIIAGTELTIMGSGIATNPYIVKSTSASSAHYVGELYGGGVVFWVDRTGQHGLILSMVDLSTSQEWSNVTNGLLGTTNSMDGKENTSAIIEQSGHTSSAAQLCVNYTNEDYGTGIYSDWYLPSVAECTYISYNYYDLQKALDRDGNPDTTPLLNKKRYWSSSEHNFQAAQGIIFSNETSRNGYKYEMSYVRAIRAF